MKAFVKWYTSRMSRVWQRYERVGLKPPLLWATRVLYVLMLPIWLPLLLIATYLNIFRLPIDSIDSEPSPESHICFGEHILRKRLFFTDTILGEVLSLNAVHLGGAAEFVAPPSRRLLRRRPAFAREGETPSIQPARCQRYTAAPKACQS